MARQFGTRSFQPETVRFISSGYQPSGLPFSAVDRKIPVNILCEADNNASTVEELSMELGVAVPYMEEEVELLVKGELLRKLDNGRYITNFFISPRECQNEVNELSCQFAERNYKVIWDVAGRVLEHGKEQGILGGAVSDADARAYLAFWIEQELENSELPPDTFTRFKRSDGGNWGVIGKEMGAVCRLPVRFFNNSVAEWTFFDKNEKVPVQWNGYQNHIESNYGRRPYKDDTPDNDQLAVMKSAAEGRALSDCSVTERECLARLIDRGFCAETGEGSVQVAALTIRSIDRGKMAGYLASLPEQGQLKEEMHRYFNAVRGIIARYCVSYLKEDFDYYVAMSTELRGIFAVLWRDSGLYDGGNAQFAALYY